MGIYYNLSLLLPLLIIKIVICLGTCNNAEYEINGECCPMCDPGKRVHKHCDEDTSTTCESCLVMTYIDIPNGLAQCLPCSVCDESNGLRVKQACTFKSNTVCEPLPGYYCIDLHSNCQKAKKHSTCKPGQYVNQTGTEFIDTVCFDCPAGSYSDGTLCKLHTNACGWAEYEINGECCPMCVPGNRVLWHCTEYTSTTCVPCPELTYTDEPTGLTICFPCRVCDAEQGLRVKRSCTRSTDTVCEPLEGFYCFEQNKGSCRFAVKHSECDPGQYIRQAGTTFTDTDCSNCTDGTYSNGSFTTCQPHSKCETEGLQEIKPGSMSSDTECGNSTSDNAMAPFFETTHKTT